jgi:hypothetical protein
VNDATRSVQQEVHPATLRLPAAFGYPLGGILGRLAIGAALLAAGLVMLSQGGVLWIAGGAALALLGGIAAFGNLRALLDPDRRKVVLDQDGVEIRYGLSRRYYGFLDYSEYRIARLGLRRVLTALPIDVEQALGKRAERVRVTMHDRPAFLTPMPLLGNGAPATLLEWQSTLNELRRAAIATAGVADAFEREAAGDAAQETRGAAIWRAREQAGAKPSRLSRRAYARGRFVLSLVFLVLLLAPTGFVVVVKQGFVALCGSAGGAGCLTVGPALQQAVMIGVPLLAVLVFVMGSARLAVRRAHDLDEDLPFWNAAFGAFGQRGLQRRLASEEGSAETNRFGPAPPE